MDSRGGKLEARPLRRLGRQVNASQAGKLHDSAGLGQSIAASDAQERVKVLVFRAAQGQFAARNGSAMTDLTPETNRWLRRLPLIVLLGAAGLAYGLYGDLLTFDVLAANRDRLMAWRDAHFALTSLMFVAVYVAVVAVSLPGATLMSLTGGFLFGVFPGVIYNVAGASIGGMAVFLVVRLGYGRDLARRIEARGGAVGRMQAGLRDNQWSVLLAMRLMPVFPFFLTNLLPALVGVRFSTFAITTALGILPAAFIFTSLGSGLGEIFARGEVPDLGILLQPEFGLPLIGLGLLALVPMVIRLYRGKGG